MTIVAIPPRFSRVGGRPCLDFANTAWREAGVPAEEGLHGPVDLVEWALETGVVEPARAVRIRRGTERRPQAAGITFARALLLREAVFRVFDAAAAGHDPPRNDLEQLARTLADAAQHRRLVPDGPRFRWEWEAAEGELAVLSWTVAQDAAELLTRGDLSRVRRCAGEECGQLFLDVSRSGRRRWCDMSHCGNLAKVQRFRSRRRAAR